MNTPSPLVPQGAFQDKGKSHVRITVFAILAVHVVLLGVLLIAGCNKKAEVAEGTVPPAGQPQDQWPTPPPATPTDGVTPVPLPIPAPIPVPPPMPADNLNPPPAPVPAPTGTIPSVDTQPTAPPDVEMREHTIAKGERLATIGKKYGVGYKAIEAANPGINPTRLKIGDKIKIPPASKAAASTTASVDPSNRTAGPAIYVVRSGDNLGKIAKNHGVTLKQLRAANNLPTDQIRVGQKLKIPARQTTSPAEGTAPPPVAPPITLPTGQ